ncbi:hypothetical protein BOTBODRAFT_33198 [Botryobasidium botryosum FD-172 SS1]|uniref:RRM domain-containing protein n=1 Tax=Botryobasidium botryosum (strain FD-172 SS1) TaxID=930990 RepID=A0A067MDB8_BOTB1|nr:hypothetical protein BOTBODRAFT_33198 [Botryobasidium botryosum FD-172 SS1]
MSRVVFVGNVPYDMTEEQLIEVFSSVGPVVGFRLVFDRETGKPRGYGFCEFLDHETAMSAVRNLNNADVGGRPLRIDLADSDPFLEGKTTTRGEILESDHPPRGPHPSGSGSGGGGPFMSGLPSGTPIPPGSTALDVISRSIASFRPGQLMEVLGQMKAFVLSSPDQARQLLNAHPQLAYALFQAMLMNNIVDPSFLQTMLAASAKSAPPQAPVSAPGQPAPPVAPSIPPPVAISQPSHVPPPHALYGQQQQQYYGTPPQHGHQPPPPPQHPAHAPQHHSPSAPQGQPTMPPGMPPAAAAALGDQQKAMLMQILSLTPDQINALPPDERNAIHQLRSQLGGMA